MYRTVSIVILGFYSRDAQADFLTCRDRDRRIGVARYPVTAVVIGDHFNQPRLGRFCWLLRCRMRQREQQDRDYNSTPSADSLIVPLFEFEFFHGYCVI